MKNVIPAMSIKRKQAKNKIMIIFAFLFFRLTPGDGSKIFTAVLTASDDEPTALLSILFKGIPPSCKTAENCLKIFTLRSVSFSFFTFGLSVNI